MPKCRYSMPDIRYSCQRDAHVRSKNGFCAMHDPDLWKRDPDLVREEFYRELLDGIREGKGLNFRGCHLPDVDLTPAKAREFGLESFEIPEATFYKGSFHGKLNASGAIFKEKADFTDADFDEAHFLDAEFKEAHFMDARFGTVGFKGAEFEEAYFEGAGFEEADFRYARFKGAYFEGAEFKKACFGDSRVEEASFEGVEFGEVDFEGAKFEEADFRYASFRSPPGFYLTIFSHSWFSGVKWPSEGKTRIEINGREMVERIEDYMLYEELAAARETDRKERIRLYERAMLDYHGIRRRMEQEGLSKEAGEFFYREKYCDRMKTQDLMVEKRSLRALPSWLWLTALDLMAGFGERPFRLISSTLIWLSSLLFPMSIWGLQVGSSSLRELLSDLGRALYVLASSLLGLGTGEEFNLTLAGKIVSTASASVGFILLNMFMILLNRKIARE